MVPPSGVVTVLSRLVRPCVLRATLISRRVLDPRHGVGVAVAVDVGEVDVGRGHAVLVVPAGVEDEVAGDEAERDADGDVGAAAEALGAVLADLRLALDVDDPEDLERGLLVGAVDGLVGQAGAVAEGDLDVAVRAVDGVEQAVTVDVVPRHVGQVDVGVLRDAAGEAAVVDVEAEARADRAAVGVGRAEGADGPTELRRERVAEVEPDADLVVVDGDPVGQAVAVDVGEGLLDRDRLVARDLRQRVVVLVGSFCDVGLVKLAPTPMEPPMLAP